MSEQIQTLDEGPQEGADEPRRQRSGPKELITKSAHVVTDAVTEHATERAQVAMDAVTQETKALANALQNAADQTEQEGARLVHEPLRRIAAFCQRVADRSASEGPKQLVADLEDFGRREPLALFAAAAALGFLGTRALRAGAQGRAVTPDTTGSSNRRAQPQSAG